MTEPTARQLQVLRVYIECGSLAAAGDALELAPMTVRNYLTICRQALDVGTTLQAFVVAVQRGLIDPNDLTIKAA